MENKEKTNVAKIILRVFGILFSIVLIPVLIAWIPAGGAMIGVSGIVSQESLVQMVSDAKLAERVLEAVEEEATGELHSEELKTEYMQSLLEDCITVEWVDSVIAEVLDAVYFGRTPDVNLDTVKETLTAKLDDLVENGFGDVYSAWRNQTPSVYFTDSFIQSFEERIEDEIIEEYGQLGATSLDELETKYDMVYGAGAFSKAVDEKAQSLETAWKEELSGEVNSIVEDAMTTAEQEVNATFAELTENPDVRTAFDYLRLIDEKASLLKVVVYGVIIGAVLLLVACFWFGTAGFVVSAIPLFIGGGLCRAAGEVKELFLTYVEKELVKDAGFMEYGDLALDMVNSVLTPVFGEISKIGNMALIIAVVLVGLAIMSAVLRKNKLAERQMQQENSIESNRTE